MALYTPLPTPPAGWTEASGGLTAAQLDETLKEIKSDIPSIRPGVGSLSNLYVDQARVGANSGVIAMATDRFDLFPFLPDGDMDINLIGVAVSTAVAASTCKLVVYDNTGTGGLPGDLLFEGGDLNLISTGYKSEAVTLSFESRQIYWLGIRSVGTATIRAVGVSASIALGNTSGTFTSYATLMRSTLTYATAAPDPWVATGFAATASAVPSIRMRIA